MLVVGNGLLASKFRSCNLPEDIIVIASGVSDSSEFRQSKFNREKELVLNYAEQGRVLIYFSSCSVELPEKMWTPYIRHKNSMESLIINNKLGLVYRLPNVVGFGGNDKTMFNFLCSSIRNEKEIIVRKNAKRSLIDVDDVVKLVKYLVTLSMSKKELTYDIVRVVLPVQYSVIEIIKTIENHYGKKAITSEGEADFLDVSKSLIVENCIKNKVIKFDNSYLLKLVKKYA
ncbi:MAG: NAD(P)-dependent oxidoreductase [Methylophilaceae bacterium]|nr:NAD(P)-dependent oxidoreductase [Methylophilaceae bacterium]